MEYCLDKEFKSAEDIATAEYEACIFTNCRFNGKDLSNCKFIECRFIDCDLSNATLYKCNFQDSSFSSCKLIGLHFDQCSTFNFSLEFKDCQLDQSVFYQLDLSRSSFVGCRMKDVDLTDANMSGISLCNCELKGAVFQQSDLRVTDLSHSVNFQIDPDQNQIQGAKFSMPEVLNLLSKYNLSIH